MLFIRLSARIVLFFATLAYFLSGPDGQFGDEFYVGRTKPLTAAAVGLPECNH